MNKYLTDVRGFSNTGIAVFRTVTTAIPGLVGVLVGGRLAEARGRRPVAAIALADRDRDADGLLPHRRPVAVGHVGRRRSSWPARAASRSARSTPSSSPPRCARRRTRCSTSSACSARRPGSSLAGGLSDHARRPRPLDRAHRHRRRSLVALLVVPAAARSRRRTSLDDVSPTHTADPDDEYGPGP